MAHPVTAFVRVRVLTPWLRLHQSLRPRDDLELTVLQDLTHQHRFVGVVIRLVHLDFAAWRKEFLAVYRLADRIDIRLAGLLNRLLPHVYAEIRGLDGIIRHPLLAVRQVVLLT